MTQFLKGSIESYGMTYDGYIYIYIYIYIQTRLPLAVLLEHEAHSDSPRLGRCLQHRGGEPEQAKGADGMQLFMLDCIAYIVDAEMN